MKSCTGADIGAAREPVEIATPLTHFLRATVTRADDGDIALASPIAKLRVLTAMARANALIFVPPDRHRIPPIDAGCTTAVG